MHSDVDTLQALVAAVVARLSTTTPPAVLTRETAAAVDDCAEVDLAIPQWTTADGQLRGVRVRALTFKERMLADRAATRAGKDGTLTTDAWRLMAEEVVAGITAPRGLTVDHILAWNDSVVVFIHQQIQRLGPLPSALIAGELARLAGGSPPPPPDPAGRHGGDADPEPLGE